MKTPAPEEMRISTTYMRMLAREQRDPQAILGPLGVANESPSDSKTISVSDFFALVHAVDACHVDRAWHLDLARRTADHFHGPLTFVLMSAPTIGDGLDAFAHYTPIRVPYLRSKTYRTGREHTYEIAEFGDLGDLRHLFLEIPFRVLHDYVAMIGDVNLSAAVLSLTYPASAERPYYEDGFDCGVLFDQEKNALAMPAAWTAILNTKRAPGQTRSICAKSLCPS